MPTYAYRLYEIAAEALLLGTLWLFRDRLSQRPGLSFLVGSIGHGIIRFGLTFYRQDVVVLWGLQETQVIAAITGLVGFRVRLRLDYVLQRNLQAALEGPDPIHPLDVSDQTARRQFNACPRGKHGTASGAIPAAVNQTRRGTSWAARNCTLYLNRH